VARDVHSRLVDLGITPVYAVPGALLRQGAEVYGAIAASGAEFLNHGDSEHARYVPETNTYESFFFYDELPVEVALKDVVDGDRAVREAIGVQPTGFRTPHFGSFQKRAQLAVLYRTLRALGYAYSTSTSPLHGFRHGPWRTVAGITEIPVTGCPRWPMGILATFGFRYAPGRRFT
jgi:hypothetical protein